MSDTDTQSSSSLDSVESIEDIKPKGKAKKVVSESSSEDEKPKTKGKVKAEDRYKETNLKAHTLRKPDILMGSIKTSNNELYTWNPKKKIIQWEKIDFNPGFYKIFDEAFTNARDHITRTKSYKGNRKCNTIKVDINQEDGSISIYNNGEGIEVVMHETKKVWIPEFVMTNMLVSENYYSDDETDIDKLTVGGKNGVGIKLTSLYSTKFVVETLDSTRKLKYKQTYTDNLGTNEKEPDKVIEGAIGEPKIEKVSDKENIPYTKVTYWPDYKRFGFKKMTDDMKNVLIKRVYDMTSCVDDYVTICLNGKEIANKSFKEYINMHYEKKPTIIYDDDTCNSRWKVAAVYDPNSNGKQESFVNGIWTYRGGTHVDHIFTQIYKVVSDHIKDKHPDLIIQKNHVLDNLTLFVSSVIEAPDFDSQCKELLTTPVSNYSRVGKGKKAHKDAKCKLSDDFKKQIKTSKLIEAVIALAKHKGDMTLKHTDGKQLNNIDVPKLVDARNAGKKGKISNTIMIFCEGDSAHKTAIRGIDVLGRDNVGAFPLKGKVSNTKKASEAKLAENAEFVNIKKILGLKQGEIYNDTKNLRYGSVLILTDSDTDGFHIKGLLLNMFSTFWPSLLDIGYVWTLNTPSIKLYKPADNKCQGKPLEVFYSKRDYESWLEDNEGHKNKIKYYKGLGTLKDFEQREVFQDFYNKVIKFRLNKEIGEIERQEMEQKLQKKKGKKKSSKKNKSESDSDSESRSRSSKSESGSESDCSVVSSKSSISGNKPKPKRSKKKAIIEATPDKRFVDHEAIKAINLAFDKEREDDRKEWILDNLKTETLDTTMNEVDISDFIHHDLVQFSIEDVSRSLPSIMDGFKPSLRKIMHVCFKREIGHRVDPIKVENLAGKVSADTSYHHGNASLTGAIVGLAQDFPGANNLNLLFPDGEFGARTDGGKTAAQPRYIFTFLENITEYIYRNDDNSILNWLVEDGTKVEPEYFAPIIPMILVNGSRGIGTGFSTNIPSCNVIDIVKNLRKLINGDEAENLTPWYRGFNGTITKVNNTKYLCKGKYTIEGNKVIITEIPIDVSIEKYMEYVKELKIGSNVIKYGKKSKGKGKSKVKKITDSVLQKKIQNEKIIAIDDNNGCNRVYIELTFDKKLLRDLIDNSDKKTNALEKYLKLTSNINTSNMYAFSPDGKITKYDYLTDILRDYKDERYKLYEKRREYVIKKLENDLDLAKYRAMFIKEVSIEKTIKMMNEQEEYVVEQLEKKKYPKLAISIDNKDKGYNYLLDMSMRSMTANKIKQLEKEHDKQKVILEEYRKKTVEDIWLGELDEFMKIYEDWSRQKDKKIEDDNDPKKRMGGKGKRTKRSGKATDKDDDDAGGSGSE